MKYKLFILILITTLLTIIIYKHNYHQSIKITSINTLEQDNNYNELLITKLNKVLPDAKINIDFTDETLEIENLIELIKENKNNIQNIIHESKVIILYIGNNDLSNEKVKNILNEYKRLFQLLRKYNNKQIIFISPFNFKYQSELINISNNYKLTYINSISYIYPYIINNNINDKGKDILTDVIIKKIGYVK